MAGKTTISNMTPAAGNLRIQTSLYGSAIPLIYGQTRVSGNLIWYGDFKAIPHTSTQSQGGKGGGGVQTQTTTYTYQAALMMALGEGPINNVLQAWRGKINYGGTSNQSAQKTYKENFSIPSGGVVTVAHSTAWVSDVTVVANVTSDTGAYQTAMVNGVDYTVSGGVYRFVNYYNGEPVTITYQANTSDISALVSLGLGLTPGTFGQAPWGYLTTSHPTQAVGYSGYAYLYAPTYDLGDTAEVVNHSFEVSTQWSVTASGDANPATVVQDILTNGRYGANFPIYRAGDFTAWANYALAQGLTVSTQLAQQKQAADWVTYFLTLSNTDVTWSQGLLKWVPLGDAACSANGATYTPNNTPVYDLTDDHFITSNAEDDPIKITRKAADDTYNCVTVQYSNRSNQYNTEPYQQKDPADIELRGLRIKATLEADAICDTTAAATLATLLLQKESAVRNTYEFTLPWVFALLEPLDIVTLTDSYQGMSRVPVRINQITETDAGDFDVIAEDCPIGMTTAPTLTVQGGAGFSHNYNVSPGSVVAPVMFEPPVALTTSGLAVWVAVTGAIPAWGGCDIWVSYDNVSYKKADTIHGGARYGVTTGAITGTSAAVPVQLAGVGGTILSGTANDAATLATLAWVGTPTGGEYMAHAAATLTGTNAYNLSGLNRAAYGTTAGTYPAGSQFVRVDQAIGKSPELDASYIGRTVYFKFTSFNMYGGAQEDISTVPVYQYTITGSALKGALGNVLNLVSVYRNNQTMLAWDAVTDPIRAITYEVRKGPTWAAAQVLGRTPYTEFVTDGDGTYWVSAYNDTGGAYSASPTTIVIAGSTIVKNVVQTWDEQATGWTGTVSGGATVSGGTIILAGTGLFSTIPLLSGVASVSYYGAMAPSGTYTIPTGHEVDIGTVQPCTVSCNYVLYGQNPYALFSAIPLVSAVASFMGAYASKVQCKVQIAISDAAGTYGAFADFVPGTFLARKIKMQAVLYSYDTSVQPVLSNFAFTVDMPDRLERTTNLALAAGGQTITYARAFQIKPNTQVTIVNATAGDDVVLTAESASGFTVQVKNGGVGVARTINTISQAY